VISSPLSVPSQAFLSPIRTGNWKLEIGAQLTQVLSGVHDNGQIMLDVESTFSISFLNFKISCSSTSARDP